MSIEQQLIAHRFNKYAPFSKDAVVSYQKCVRDDEGNKLYFVNCDLYDYTNISGAPLHLKQDLQPHYEVQFNSKSGDTFNVTHFSKGVEDTLRFYAEVYFNLDCLPYDFD